MRNSIENRESSCKSVNRKKIDTYNFKMRNSIGRGQFAEVVKRAVYTPRAMDVAVKVSSVFILGIFFKLLYQGLSTVPLSRDLLKTHEIVLRDDEGDVFFWLVTSRPAVSSEARHRMLMCLT